MCIPLCLRSYFPEFSLVSWLVLFVLYVFQGIALLDRTSRPETICLLRVEDLPEDTVERFNHLFTLREKWTEEDITPYIQLVLSIQIIKGFN